MLSTHRRILETEDEFGRKLFYPQKRIFWIFWATMWTKEPTYDGARFNTYEEAIEFLKSCPPIVVKETIHDL